MNQLKIYLLIASTLFGCTPQLALTDSTENPSIDFELYNNILIVEAYVNDKWAKFIIDTGASTSILDFNQSKKYSFSYTIDPDKRLTGFGGRTNLMKTSEFTFNLKGLDKRNYSFFASDLSGLNVALSGYNQRVLGILGSDFLQTNGAVIDYRNARLFIVKVE